MEEGGMRRWSQRRWEEIKIKLEPFLLQAGFTSSEYRWVPVTSLGTNIAQRIDPEVCSWYKGPSLLELVDSLPVAERDPEGSLRVPILAKRKEEDVCFLDGKVEAGTLVVGE
jgi:peptide chain release factor subunit 3